MNPLSRIKSVAQSVVILVPLTPFLPFAALAWALEAVVRVLDGLLGWIASKSVPRRMYATAERLAIYYGRDDLL
jgi:hypothetical protein